MKSPDKVRRRVIIYVVELLTLFAIYFTTARLGLSLGPVSRFATLVWFPSGTAMAALLLVGYRLWPAILLGKVISLSLYAPTWSAWWTGEKRLFKRSYQLFCRNHLSCQRI